MSSDWPAALPAGLPAADELHVWRLSLNVPAADVPRLHALLSADEQQRAARFLREEVRRRFVVGRGRLRQLLGRLLDQPAEEIEFQYTALGKPFLLPSTTGETLHFNLSNSHEMALIAVSRRAEVGVDVEWLRDVKDFLGLARRYFADQEVSDLQSLSPELRLRGFFHGWTRKEAILKAVGTGLTTPLREVIVTMVPGQPARLLRMGQQEQGHFELYELTLDRDYTGALAARGPRADLRLWSWPGGPAQ